MRPLLLGARVLLGTTARADAFRSLRPDGLCPPADAYRRQTFALLEARPGDRLLDVGCGTGEDARMLGRLVGRSGWVLGVDSNEATVAEAQRRTDGLRLAGLDVPVEYGVGDAHRLGLATGTFDGCRADRLFQGLADPEGALRELIRVARTGARIVVSNPNWSALIAGAPAQAVTRRIKQFVRASVATALERRRLTSFFERCGLRDVTAVPTVLPRSDFYVAADALELLTALEAAHRAGSVSAVEAAGWLDDMEWASRAGRFSGIPTGVVVAGRKPGCGPPPRRGGAGHGAIGAGRNGQLVSQGSC